MPPDLSSNEIGSEDHGRKNMTRDNWYIHKILEKARDKANLRLRDDLPRWALIVGGLIVALICVRW